MSASPTPVARLVDAIGDIVSPVYPRSAVKPFQALLLVESGAADAFGLGDAELALACASHGGEPMHVERVDRWLAALGLDDKALVCGGHPPSHAPSAAALAATGLPPRRAHDNCSGKHTGMLTVARHLGAPLAGYRRPIIPCSARWPRSWRRWRARRPCPSRRSMAAASRPTP